MLSPRSNQIVPDYFYDTDKMRLSPIPAESKDLSLDVLLLKLLFKRTSRKVEKLALELTLAKFN